MPTKDKFLAFTIVELLVVIVVIGILAAITIFSYSGISAKATVASLQSDLDNAKRQLALYNVDHSAFPTLPLAITGSNYCPSDDSKYCFKASSGNVLTYSPTTTTSPQSYTLVDINTASTSSYLITNNTAPTVFIPYNWYAGIAATALANKWVYKADLAGTYQYQTTTAAVANPQGVTGLDPLYPTKMSLVSPQANPSVDFSVYTSQNACKAIGGRVPNMQELSAIYTSRANYGNNFQVSPYWSSTEFDSTYAYNVYFDSADTGGIKTNSKYIRCVAG